MSITNSTIFNGISGSNNNFGDNSNVIVNSYNNGNQEEFIKLMSQLTELFKTEELSQEEKDSAIDSIEVITEQVTATEPKKTRIKNAWKNLINLAAKAPTVLAGASKIKDAIDKSAPYIERIAGEDLPKLSDFISKIAK